MNAVDVDLYECGAMRKTPAIIGVSPHAHQCRVLVDDEPHPCPHQCRCGASW